MTWNLHELLPRHYFGFHDLELMHKYMYVPTHYFTFAIDSGMYFEYEVKIVR